MAGGWPPHPHHGQRQRTHLSDVSHRVTSITLQTQKLRGVVDSLARQHDVIPSDESLVNPITHVALAFMRSGLFLDSNRTEWPSDRSVGSARGAFAPGTKILVAIGGWGDTDFSIAAQDDTSRKSFAHNVARMVEATGADGALCFSPTYGNHQG